MWISVIIPVRDRPMELIRAVDSVLLQTHQHFELIVVDDGSRLPVTGLPDSVRVFRTAGAGVSAARNFGVAQSKFEWLAFLDSDDCWFSHKLESQVRFHQQNPGFRVSQTDERWIRRGRRTNKKLHHELACGHCFELCLKQCAISPSSVLLQRSLFSELGGFDTNLPVCEDYDLWLRLSLKEPVGLIREELIEKYGGHEDQLSRSQKAIDRYRIYALLKLVSTSNLEESQLVRLSEQALHKLHVLISGAQKRAQNILVFAKLSEFFEQCAVSDSAALRDQASSYLIEFGPDLLKNMRTA